MQEDIALIGLEWSGTQLRAIAYDASGDVIARSVVNEAPAPRRDEFPDRSLRHLERWLAAPVTARIIACGDIGQMIPAPDWVPLPCLRSDLASRMAVFGGMNIVPWLIGRDPVDYSGGAEAVLMGLDEEHANICIAAHNTRHMRLEHGRVTGLSTHPTAEMHALVLHSGLVGVNDPSPGRFDPSVFQEWVEAGLDLSQPLTPFRVKAAVVSGQLDASLISSALSGLLIGADVAAHYQPGDEVLVVADGRLAEAYGLAFDALGADVIEASYSETLEEGLFELADVSGLLGGRECAL